MDILPDGSIDMVLCDLPYGSTACKWDTPLSLPWLWKQYARVVKPGGAIVLFGAQPFTSILGASNIANLRYSWVWEKNRATNHMNAKKQPMRRHEDILVFSTGQTEYNPQGLVPFGKTVKNSNVDAATTGADPSSTFSGGLDRNPRVQQWTGYPDSILRFDVVRNGIHPTEKPVDLLEYLIKTYTSPGAVVLDNCMGSGATGEAALKCGRSFIGIEWDRDGSTFFEQAKKRLETYKLTLDGVSSVIFS